MSKNFGNDSISLNLGISRYSGKLLIKRGLKGKEGSSAVKTGHLELLKEMKIDKSSETAPSTLNEINATQDTILQVPIKKEILCRIEFGSCIFT